MRSGSGPSSTAQCSTSDAERSGLCLHHRARRVAVGDGLVLVGSDLTVPKKKHGRGRGPQPLRRRPIARPPRAADGPEDQQLIQTLRSALRSGEPLEFLAVVSGFLEVTDSRNRDPFAQDEGRPGLDDLVESFIGTPYAETTAAPAIKALVTDELLAARIGRELETRRHPLPEWLTVLDQARLDPFVWFMTHVLGDGDDYLIGVTLPSGEALSALLYVDHNMGTVVKDASWPRSRLRTWRSRWGS